VTESVEVAIIGAGQAGLAASWYLKQANVDHVVLEAGRVAETWRSRRWDSFCLVTPNWSVKLPGAEYAGPDPDGFMPLGELIDYFQGWANSFDAPVQADCPVLSLEKDGDTFILNLAREKIRARKVIVATGAYQRAHRPPGAERLPATVSQLLAEDYSNPSALPSGAVLIIGSGQTGCQLAEELHEAGRTVLIACGRCPWGPRRLGGRDIVRWAALSGFLDRTPATLPGPTSRLIGNIVTTGHGGGHDLHLRTLRQMGVELLGHFAGADGNKMYFADDLAASADFGDARLADLWKYMEAYCASSGEMLPDFEWPLPLRVDTRTELDASTEGIGAVIWTSGYRPDYGWVRLPVFDEMGFPIQRDGASDTRGLYFAGVHWMRKLKSSILYGVAEDAALVASHITASKS